LDFKPSRLLKKCAVSQNAVPFATRIKTRDCRVRHGGPHQSSGDGDTMNSFTVMRHCLYAGDKAVFSSMLTDAARNRFDAWLVENLGQLETTLT
jgi:hypothetical protein